MLTLFPGIFSGPLDESILARARERSLVDVRVHDLRPFGIGKHHVCDDTPYGGGAGMVMKPRRCAERWNRFSGLWRSARRQGCFSSLHGNAAVAPESARTVAGAASGHDLRAI